MALHWEIEPQARMISMTATGDVTQAECNALLDNMAAADAVGYRKLFDGSAGDTSMSPMELLAIGVRIKSLHNQPVGALAIVLPPDKFELVARILGILATAKRPMRLFKTRAAAERWLLELEYRPLAAGG